LIRVEGLGGSSARVRILDAVGMLAVDGLQLTIEPKIPQRHFLDIVSRSSHLPEIATLPAGLEEDIHFAVLICQWFLVALERILAEGLLRDYREIREETSAVRGRLLSLPTAHLFYRGRLAVAAEFEEFDHDNALNRVLLAAARILVGAPFLPEHLRRRGLRAAARMEGVGEMTPADLDALIDRRSAYYCDGFLLAKEVIASSGRSLRRGDRKSWTFLFRTPIPVEEGLRSIIRGGLSPMAVRNTSVALGGTTMRVHPDLVFGNRIAVGDVKYKTDRSDWDRGDLYQVVAFATAAEVETAVLVDFRRPDVGTLEPVWFDRVKVSNVSWPTDPALSPREAATLFVVEIESALDRA
jgi:5-methylcytosine-specific restriction endonuclease McrBC regulatory subunit McrC